MAGSLIRELLYPFTWLILLPAPVLIYAGVRRVMPRKRLAAIAVPYVCLMLLTTPAVSMGAAWLFESRVRPADVSTLSGEVIVVLGGGVAIPGAHRPETPLLENSLRRTLLAAKLYHAGAAPRVLCSGGRLSPDPAAVAVGQAMADMLVQLGVPESAIVVEGASRDTWQNAKFSARILQEEGWQDVLLLTDALHLPRAGWCFRKQGVSVRPVGCWRRSGDFRGSWVQFLPRPHGAQLSQEVFHEAVGMLWYRLRY